MTFPCVVVGGGLAGAACALELARNGYRVLIIEKTQGNHHKVCGEFLSVEAQTLISYLGVDIWKLGATEVSSLHLVCRTDFPRVGLPFRAAGLSRFCFDEALLQATVDAGAEVVRGVAVTGLEPDERTITVSTAERRFRAACVVLATGKHDIRAYRRSKGSMVGFKLQLSVGMSTATLLRNVVHLTVFPGGYAGACL